jgi:hypothetical protein
MIACRLRQVLVNPAMVQALRELKALWDEGVFTEEEFTIQKKLILSGLA